ncbi:hypothetical protein Taro_007946, partial [Colocasia esculenta]|nr:hypothetical protein [Colocasia esculenta]
METSMEQLLMVGGTTPVSRLFCRQSSRRLLCPPRHSPGGIEPSSKLALRSSSSSPGRSGSTSGSFPENLLNEREGQAAARAGIPAETEPWRAFPERSSSSRRPPQREAGPGASSPVMLARCSERLSRRSRESREAETAAKSTSRGRSRMETEATRRARQETPAKEAQRLAPGSQ